MRLLSTTAAIVGLSAFTLAGAQQLSSNHQAANGSKQKVAGVPPVNPGPGVGSDDCSTPDPIAGLGTYNFDNSAATTGTEGQNEVNCDFFGSTAVALDVWYEWTSDVTGDVDISTVGNTSVDTKIAVYPAGGCPVDGTSLVCNDDDVGLQSTVTFPAVNGTSYLIQLGSFPATTPAGGTGTFDITANVPPVVPPNDDCSTPNVIAGQGNWSFDNSLATTGTQGQNEVNCDFFGSTEIKLDIWYEWTADADGIATLSTVGLTTVDTKAAVYPGTGCPVDGTSLACNDDETGGSFQSDLIWNVTNGTTYTIQLGSFPATTPAGGPGDFNITISAPPGGCVHDDGTSETSIGGTNGGDVLYMNTFDGSCLDHVCSVRVAYGSPVLAPNITPGSVAKIGVWEDPNDDGDPSDAVLLSTVTTAVIGADTDKLIDYTFNPGVPVSGKYFVGAVVTHNAGEFPATQDADNNNNDAWLALSGTQGGFDMANLTNNDLPPGLASGFGFPGVFLIRVNGGVEGELGTAFALGTAGCPCGNNNGGVDAGCLNTTGGGAVLATSGSDVATDNSLRLHVHGAPANKNGVWLAGEIGTPTPLKDGLFGLVNPVIRMRPGTTDAVGCTTSDFSVHRQSHKTAGQSGYYQFWFRDGMGPCDTGSNFTNGRQIDWQ